MRFRTIVLHGTAVGALLCAAQGSYASYSVEEGVWIQDPGHTHLSQVAAQRELTIDHLTPEGYEVYGPKGLRAFLDQKKVLYWALERSSSDKKTAEGYPTFTQLEEHLKAAQAAHPGQAELFSIGKTVTGKDLWMMKISNHPGRSELKPEVKYISSMHGDEVTGRELMTKLIDELLTSYGQDPRITALVDNTDIYIMPSMNPDGTQAGTRGNGRNADLNRDFPDWSVSNPSNDPQGLQPETQAVMKLQAEHHFALSANFHGGAEVVNYMWDAVQELHPLDSLLKSIALGYASQVPYLRNSTSFPQGITNGFAWYVVKGGMQDWSYYWFNDTQFTIELSGTKTPDYTTMDDYYRMNRESLLGFLETVHQGAGFDFRAAGRAGQVEIFALGDGGAARSLGSFAFSGSQFFKVLEPGNYRMTVRPDGGQEVSFETSVQAHHIYPNGNFKTLD